MSLGAENFLVLCHGRYRKIHFHQFFICYQFQNGLTAIFGGFVAYGISFDNNPRLLAPYKILYLLLGGLAILVGIAVLLWMPDSPVNAHVLSHEEKVAAIERVRDDQGGTENKTLKKSQVIEALTDIRTWLIVLTTLLSQSDFLTQLV